MWSRLWEIFYISNLNIPWHLGIITVTGNMNSYLRKMHIVLYYCRNTHTRMHIQRVHMFTHTSVFTSIHTSLHSSPHIGLDLPTPGAAPAHICVHFVMHLFTCWVLNLHSPTSLLNDIIPVTYQPLFFYSVAYFALSINSSVSVSMDFLPSYFFSSLPTCL